MLQDEMSTTMSATTTWQQFGERPHAGDGVHKLVQLSSG